MASWNSYDWDNDGWAGTREQQRLPDSRSSSAPRPRTDLAGGLDPTGPGNDLEVPDGFNADAVGLAGVTPFGARADRAQDMATPMASPPPGLAGYANFRFQRGGPVPGYSEGGAIDTDENPMMDTMGSQLQSDINSALSIVKDVIGYGRKLHGLGGDDSGGAVDTAQMPSTPFRETPVPQPMPKPNSLPYGPNEKPFGRRTAGLEPKTLPSSPGQYTPTDRPMPKPNAFPYGPGQVPFGKRSDAQPAHDEATETPQQEMAEGAIDTDDEESA